MPVIKISANLIVAYLPSSFSSKPAGSKYPELYANRVVTDHIRTIPDFFALIFPKSPIPAMDAGHMVAWSHSQLGFGSMDTASDGH
jgi:hypothetical protein